MLVWTEPETTGLTSQQGMANKWNKDGIQSVE